MASAIEGERRWGDIELVLTTKPEETLECLCQFCENPTTKTYIGEFDFDTDPRIFTNQMPGYICKSEKCIQVARECASEDGTPEDWESWLPTYLSGEAIYEMASKSTKILAQYGQFEDAMHFVEVALTEEKILAQERTRLAPPQAT
jgi:hypothetical protein